MVTGTPGFVLPSTSPSGPAARAPCGAELSGEETAFAGCWARATLSIVSSFRLFCKTLGCGLVIFLVHQTLSFRCRLEQPRPDSSAAL